MITSLKQSGIFNRNPVTKMNIPSKSLLFGTALVLMALSVHAQEQPSADEAFRMASDGGIPIDWTHRHIVFSSPSADPETLTNIKRDPRYWLQLVRRPASIDADSALGARAANIATVELGRPQGEELEDDGDMNSTSDEAGFGFGGHRGRSPPWRRPLSDRDWSEAMNTGFKSFGGSKYPAKYAFNSANPVPSCTNDYVVFTLGGSTSSSFNIVAFTNLYLNNGGGSSFCSGTTPTLLFAYYASTGSTAGGLNTSPVLSLDGTQIALIEAAASGAIFHVLKWQAASSVPAFPNSTASLHDCAVSSAPPCEYSVAYAGTNTATRSSPFVDYSTDTAYLSDNAGNVYAISPVFSGGTPAIKSGWPINVGSVTPLGPPVYDSVSQRVFFARATNGSLYDIQTTAACGVTPAPCLGGSISVGSGTITEPPIVDSTTQKVFVFSNAAPSGSGITGAAVVQTSTSLASRIVAGLGGGSVNSIRVGDFNNAYYSSGAGAVGAALYACGDSSSTGVDAPVLYAFPFASTPTAGTLNPSALTGSGLFLTTGQAAAGSCSSITENYNQTTGNDRIFVGVASNCATGEAGGCILSYDITSGFPSGTPSTAPAAHAAEPGGTSGIIIDNVADQSSGSKLTTDIYFLSAETSGGVGQSCSTYSGGATSGNCAVSLTQNGLH